MTRMPILFLIGLIYLVAACSVAQDDTLTDLSLKTLQPCAPPCWYGMELGKSSVDDFKATLLQLPFVDHSEFSYYESNDPEKPSVVQGSLDWRCVRPARDWCGHAFFIDGKLGGIYLPGFGA